MYRLPSFVRTVLPRPATCVSLAAGVALGLLILAGFTRIRLAFGGSLMVELGIGAAVCLGLLIPGLLTRRFATRKRAMGTRSRTASGLLLAAVWGLAGPLLFPLIAGLVSLISLQALQSGWTQFFIVFVTSAAWLTPLTVGTFWTFSSRSPDVADARRASIGIGGIVLCWLTVPAIVAFGFDVTLFSWIAAGICLVLSWMSLSVRRSGSTSADGETDLVSQSAGHASEVSREVASRSEGHSLGVWVLTLLCGMGLFVTVFVTRQIVSQNLLSECALWAGLLGGLAVGIMRPRFGFQPKAPSGSQTGEDAATAAETDRRRSTFSGADSSDSLLLLSLAAWCGLVLTAYPIWTAVSLWLTVRVSHPLLLLAARSAFLVLLVFPCGLMLGRAVSATSRTGHRPVNRSRMPPFVIAVCLTAGYALAGLSGLSVTQLGLTVILAAALLGATLWLRSGRPLPRRRSSRIVCGLVCGVICLGLLFIGNFSPARSEKMLFSTQSFLAYRQGTSRDRLPWLDDGRLLAEFEASGHRVSLWKHRGAQLLVRRNGIYSELRSSDAELYPQNAGEIMPAVLPLVLHPAAEHILVLGMHTPTLETCDAYPLLSVTTLDERPASRKLLNWLIDERLLPESLEDDRFQLVQAAPTFAMKSRHPRTYDVIVLPDTSLVTTDGAARLTGEFYARVRSQLSENGLFCQRIPYYDLGPKTLKQIATTIRSAFPGVLVMESVPGELLFVGSRDRRPLIDVGVVDRLQTPQTRHVLARAGWDWSVPLGRGGLDQDSMTELLATSGTGRNTGAAGLSLAFGLPVEIARWGDKAQQSRAVLGQHGKTLGSFLDDAPTEQEIAQRLEDMGLAEKVLREHPDQPWTYRNMLKQQLKKRPRDKIIQTSGGGLKRGLHPEDQRRKEYLRTLGIVATKPHPDPEEIVHLARFEAPFDPLLTFFVHHEAAHLLRRSGQTPKQELRHVLHTVYYSSGADSSVRNVCRAIQLLCEEPESVPIGAERWDHLNGLMDVMRARWQFRQQQSSRSPRSAKYEPIDAERSVEAVEQALQAMAVHYVDAGLTDVEWSCRKAVLEETLLQPLRRHRSEQFRRMTALSRRTTDE